MEDDTDPRQPREVTREELYKAVWSTPISVLASKYGISNVGLAKICRRLRVPTPGRGYWARMQHGQKLAPSPLPPPAPDQVITAVIRPRSPPPATSTADAPMEIPSVPITKTLAGAHAAVIALKRVVDDCHVGTDGMVVVPGYDGTVLRVSKGMVHRALLILNSLCKALDARGHAAQFRKEDTHYRSGYVLTARFAREEVGIQIGERSTKTERVSTKRPSIFGPEYDYSPTGRLRLTLGRVWGRSDQRSWGDGARNRLEDELGKVLAIEHEAALKVEQTRRREAERIAAQAAAERQEEEKRRAAYQAALVEDLEAMAKAWELSARLKTFLDAAGSVLAGDQATEGTRAWLQWAHDHARAIDPLARPEILAKKLAP